MFRSWKWSAGLAVLTLAVVMIAATPALAIGPGVYYVRGYGWGYDTWGRADFNRGWEGAWGPGPGDPGWSYITGSYTNPYNYSPGYSNSYFPNGNIPSAPYYYNPSMNIGPKAYTAPTQNPSATIDVSVPQNAKVWFDDAPTQQTGASRSFGSPPLSPNAIYYYTVRAQWDDNGKMKEETRRIEVRAGQTSKVDFTMPASK
jgi:uncharacterized protein (TIGR03000 family)